MGDILFNRRKEFICGNNLNAVVKLTDEICEVIGTDCSGFCIYYCCLLGQRLGSFDEQCGIKCVEEDRKHHHDKRKPVSYFSCINSFLLFYKICFDFVFGYITQFVFFVCVTENDCAAGNHSFGEVKFFKKFLVIIEKSDCAPYMA